MKKITLLLAFVMAAMSVSATVSVCGTYADENDGHFSSPFIKSGTITWNATSKTLTLDNAIVEYNTTTPSDYIYPMRVTEDATIVIHGDCKLITTGYVALALDGYSSKSVTIQGDGSLYTSCTWIDIFLVCTHLTIKDITLQTEMGIGNNAAGTAVGLTFDHVGATIKGGVSRIGDGITFERCAITYPEDAYIVSTDYGDYIRCGNNQTPDQIIISRSSTVFGDVNGDGEVNIADVNAIIDVILGGGNNTAADVNKDGEINIGDINAVIDVILGGHHANSIVGSWISEYGVDGDNRYDILDYDVVGYDFNGDYTGRFSYYDNNGTSYMGLRWRSQDQRLSVWYDDGGHEELYYKIDENGYLLLATDEHFNRYTAYRPN